MAKVNVGDLLNAESLGHQDIDIDTLLLNSGYSVHESAPGEYVKLPDDILKIVNNKKLDKSDYGTLSESVNFICIYCGEQNSSLWRTDNKNNSSEFTACGKCNRVNTVRT